MTSPAVKAWLSFLLVALALYGSFTISKVYRAHANPAVARSDNTSAITSKSLAEALGPVPLEKFTFTNCDGEPFDMQRLSGKVWVASYFFATCPGFCLQMNQEISKIARDMAGQDVTFVSFTVDPENDTPEELKKYAERMLADGRQWVFLTGEMDEIRDLGQQYLKMPVSKDHLDKLIVVGRDARIHGIFASRDPSQVTKLKAVIAECIAESQPAEAEEPR
jgi:cytochrome oxidase Cu insertion factor (SCO1/SenC/PrrC family)